MDILGENKIIDPSRAIGYFACDFGQFSLKSLEGAIEIFTRFSLIDKFHPRSHSAEHDELRVVPAIWKATIMTKLMREDDIERT